MCTDKCITESRCCVTETDTCCRSTILKKNGGVCPLCVFTEYQSVIHMGMEHTRVTRFCGLLCTCLCGGNHGCLHTCLSFQVSVHIRGMYVVYVVWACV